MGSAQHVAAQKNTYVTFEQQGCCAQPGDVVVIDDLFLIVNPSHIDFAMP